MIRCSECKYLEERHFKHKTFLICTLSKILRIWTKVPKTHPHWCPKWKEENK